MNEGSQPVRDFCDRWIGRALWLAYKLLRIWWFVRRPHHHGAVIAIWFDGRILLVQHSYRDGLGMPGGGIQSGESALDAVIRETREEIGISLDPKSVSLAVELTGTWDYRYDHVRVFETSLLASPVLLLDGREVITARFMDAPAALSQKLPVFLRLYLERRATGLVTASGAGAAGKD